MTGGRGVRLAENSFARKSDFFVALQGVDFPGQADTMVSLACGFSKSFILSNLADEITVTDEIDFVEEKGKFFSKRVRSFRDLPLDEPTLTPVDPSLVQDRMAAILAKKWDWIVAQNESLRSWMDRWKFLRRHAPEAVPEVTPGQIAEVVNMAAFGQTKMEVVLKQDFVSFMEMTLPREVVRLVHEQVPAKFAAPSGISHAILYGEEHSAYVEVRLQEVFGLNETPKLVFGKIPLTFRLLSPAYRPMQVTSDLANFWRKGYVEVRKELRARYPKHSWPEDPLTAKPEAKGRRR